MRRIMALVAGGVCVGILCVMIFFHIQGIQVLAMTGDGNLKRCSVTLEYGREKPIQNVSFSIFQVAEKKKKEAEIHEGYQADNEADNETDNKIDNKTDNKTDKEKQYVRTDKFALEHCPVQLDFEDASRWKEMAETLEIYVHRDHLTPIQTGKTDLNGRLKFENLEEGIYLVIGEIKTNGQNSYIPDALLAVLEETENSGGQLVLRPKYREKTEVPKSGSKRDHDHTSEKIRRKAVKIWEEGEHPGQAVAQLLRDGEIVKRAVLSEKNQWNHQWENLSSDYSWTVAEEVPEGYLVSICQEGETFLMTNRRAGKGTEERQNVEEDVPEEKDQKKPEKLPQTGILWFPVWISGIAGILILWSQKKSPCKTIVRATVKTAVGAGCMILSCVLAGKNGYEEIQAWRFVRESQKKIEYLNEERREKMESAEKSKEAEDSEKSKASERSKEQEKSDSDNEIPLYMLDSERKMPEKMIDGEWYVGVLELPSLQRTLPVMGKWSDEKLKHAPCCYSGSAYTQDLVIAGHNYRAHFSGIAGLKKGDQVIFTDMDGNCFRYEVTETEILDADEIWRMTESWWPLTIFTCTAGGRQRVAVRCDLTVQSEDGETEMY